MSMFIKEDACSCLPSSNLIEMTKRIDSRMHQNHNVGCSVQCPGDNTDDCGGNDYFSVYNITENEIRGKTFILLKSNIRLVLPRSREIISICNCILTDVI